MIKTFCDRCKQEGHYGTVYYDRILFKILCKNCFYEIFEKGE